MTTYPKQSINRESVRFAANCRPTGRSRALSASIMLAVGLAGIALSAGCGDSRQPGPSRLSPRSLPFLDAVAVPSGFQLDDEMTEDYQSGGKRMARHVYSGNADLHAVRNFYREQMPLLGWNCVSDENVKGMISIRFEKADEVCTVRIEKQGFFGRTTVQTIVMPFNRKPSEPPKQRPVP